MMLFRITKRGCQAPFLLQYPEYYGGFVLKISTKIYLTEGSNLPILLGSGPIAQLVRAADS
jgi:hypothetical protein